MENLGDRIKQLRFQKNLTVEQLAKQIGVAKSAISFWENNINEPKANYISKLATVFNVSTDYLLGLEDDFGNKKTPSNIEIPESENIITISARGSGKKTVKLSDEQIASLKSIVEAFEAQKK